MATKKGTPAGDVSAEGEEVQLLPPAERSDFIITARPEAEALTQTGLFGDEELPIPKPPAPKYEELYVPEGGITRYKKGIAALHSIPVGGNHTLNSRRVMDAIVAIVQLHFARMPKHQREMLRELEASPMFRVTKGELRHLAGIASKKFGRVEDVLDFLHEMRINWNIMGEDSKVEWQMTSRFLASWGKGVGKYDGQVCFSIDPRVLDLILEPAFYARLNLDIQRQLGTETSYALYQNAWRFIGTAHKVTTDYPVAYWIELLMGPCRYVQTRDGEKFVVDYSEWKARYLKPAIEKINSIAGLAHTLELVEKKVGNSLKVKRLQFRFIPKQQEKLDLPMTWPDPVLASLKSLGFEDSDVAELAQGFSLDEVVESLDRYRKAEAMKKSAGQRIGAPTAFFNGILSNVHSQAKFEAEEMEAIEKKARAEELERRSKEQQERASFEFGQFQTKRVMENFGFWPEERRAALWQAFSATPEYQKGKLLWGSKGMACTHMGAWGLFKTWVFKSKPEDYNELLPNPEDRSLEAWLVWRLSAVPA